MPINRETEGDTLRIVVTQDLSTKLLMGIFFGIFSPLAIWLFVTKTLSIIRHFEWQDGGISMVLQSLILFGVYGFMAWFIVSLAVWPLRHRLKAEVDADSIRTEEGPRLLWPTVQRRELKHGDIVDIRAATKHVVMRDQAKRRRFELARVYAETGSGEEVLLLRAPDMSVAGEFAVEIRDHLTRLTGREWPM